MQSCNTGGVLAVAPLARSRVRSHAIALVQVLKQKEDQNSKRQYLVIINVRADHVFSKYFKIASQADLALFRGMFMTVTLAGDVPGTIRNSDKPVITDCAVHQAFLPKFENETQDTDVAAQILAESNQKYMLVTLKHSGSLATLSYNLMGAKNSQGNIYTNVAILLLKAHYERVAASACEPLNFLVLLACPCGVSTSCVRTHAFHAGAEPGLT